jgi:hypothetical protein
LFSTTGGTYTVQASVVGGPTITQTVQVGFLLTYTDDILPIFQNPFNLGAAGTTTPCLSCHAPGSTQAPDLSFAQLTQEYESEQVVIPGDPDNSLLVRALEHGPGEATSEFMPSSSQTLPADVIGRIRQWIAQEATLRQ